MDLIEVEKVEKVFLDGETETHALQGVSFKICEGEFVTVMGPSGSGKSTILHILGFLDRPTGGEYFFDGRNMSQYSDDELAQVRNKKMGFVFQAFNLLPRTTVLDNVKLPLIYANVSGEKQIQMAKKAISAVNLSERLYHKSSQLSGGEKQRVAIARALVNHPSVIFADEPTGNLDSKSGAQVLEILQKLNSEGKTIILITHEIELAEYGKRIINLRDGQIVADKSI